MATIKDLRKVEGLGRLLQVYSVKAQSLTIQSESIKIEEVIFSTIRDLYKILEEINPLIVVDQVAIDAAFLKRVIDGEEVGICESCQG